MQKKKVGQVLGSWRQLADDVTLVAPFREPLLTFSLPANFAASAVGSTWGEMKAHYVPTR